MKKEDGFTLVELMTVIGLAVIMLALSASAIRHFWLVRSLDGGRAEVVSQLRELQQRVTTETTPLVFGARFPTVPSSRWGLVRYNITTGTCTEYEPRSFDAGVVVQGADFDEPSWIGTCRSALGANNEFVFFFARGSATQGALGSGPGANPAVELRQPALGRSRYVGVTGITGRVTG